MSKLKIGVVGIGRGRFLYQFCLDQPDVELVAVCDKWEEGLKDAQKIIHNDSVRYYTDFDEFLLQDMDVVMLANYATEHAPLAIKAMKAGKNVISEVLPVQNLSEAVQLIECVEQTGKQYFYAENYCFMPAPREMKRLFDAGNLGTFEYAEGEYLHNCELIWDRITVGDPDHWRNTMTAFFYCTHSVGPILHITGKRPQKVTGFELPFNARMHRMGAKAGFGAIEMVTFDDGSMFKSLHGVGSSKDSAWFSMYGTLGRAESARLDASAEETTRLYISLDKEEGKFGAANQIHDNYIPTDDWSEFSANYAHGGSDYYCLRHACNKLLGKDGDVVDVYEAIDMWLVGFFGYLSVLQGNLPLDIPDFRIREVRDQYRYDVRCTDPKVAKDQLLPSYSKGTPVIEEEVYEIMRRRWKERWEREQYKKD